MKRNAPIKSLNAFHLFAASILLIFTSSISSAKNTAEDFTLWKDTHFHRFFINKQADFSKYKKIAFLPMDYKSTVIDPKAKKRMQLSWENFVETEMPDIATRFDKEVQEMLIENEHFSATSKAGDDVLIVTFKAKEIIPKTYLDNGLMTVGRSTLTMVGYLTYQVVLMDGNSRKIVGMIEDDHTIAPNTRATGEQANNLGNQRRAWSTSLHGWIKSFFKDLENLPGNKA